MDGRTSEAQRHTPDSRQGSESVQGNLASRLVWGFIYLITIAFSLSLSLEADCLLN
jgi:hypothetical protein